MQGLRVSCGHEMDVCAAPPYSLLSYTSTTGGLLALPSEK